MKHRSRTLHECVQPERPINRKYVLTAKLPDNKNTCSGKLLVTLDTQDNQLPSLTGMLDCDMQVSFVLEEASNCGE